MGSCLDSLTNLNCKTKKRQIPSNSSTDKGDKLSRRPLITFKSPQHSFKLSMSEGKPTKYAICEDVYLYTSRNSGPPVSFSYEIECCKFNNLHFTMDFTGSENFELESGGLVVKVDVKPFKRAKVGVIVLQDSSKGANLKNTYR